MGNNRWFSILNCYYLALLEVVQRLDARRNQVLRVFQTKRGFPLGWGLQLDRPVLHVNGLQLVDDGNRVFFHVFFGELERGNLLYFSITIFS